MRWVIVTWGHRACKVPCSWETFGLLVEDKGWPLDFGRALFKKGLFSLSFPFLYHIPSFNISIAPDSDCQSLCHYSRPARDSNHWNGCKGCKWPVLGQVSLILFLGSGWSAEIWTYHSFLLCELGQWDAEVISPPWPRVTCLSTGVARARRWERSPLVGLFLCKVLCWSFGEAY